MADGSVVGSPTSAWRRPWAALRSQSVEAVMTAALLAAAGFVWWRWGIEWIWVFIGTAMLVEGGLKVSFALTPVRSGADEPRHRQAVDVRKRRKLVAWWLLAGGLRALVGVGMVLFGLAGLFGSGGH